MVSEYVVARNAPGLPSIMKRSKGKRTSHVVLDWPKTLVSYLAMRKIAPWLIYGNTKTTLAYAQPRLINIVNLVTARENACRYSYGATRMILKVNGYGDAEIDNLEEEVESADDVIRGVVAVARKFARSDPRPVRDELAELERLGLTRPAISEIVFAIALSCFSNRIGPFLALQPLPSLERAANTAAGRLALRFLFWAVGNKVRFRRSLSKE